MINLAQHAQAKLFRLGISSYCCVYPTCTVTPSVELDVFLDSPIGTLTISFDNKVSLESLAKRGTVFTPSHYQVLRPYSKAARRK